VNDAPHNCKAPFVLYHDLELMDECEVSWWAEAGIHYNATLGTTVSTKCAAWYQQASGYESPMDAVNLKPTCDELHALHSFTNQLEQIYTEQLPFDGFRTEVFVKLFNSLITLPALGQFWKDAYLEEDSVFSSMYFSSYEGLFVMFPAHSVNSTYNALIRPWYQRASSYPGTLVFTTPYEDAMTGVLVASGAVTIHAPNSSFPFGVAAFDYEFTEFLSFWNDTMSAVCDQSGGHYCYLVDSSAFLLYFDGIEDHLGDDDIGHKFLGDEEPALMQSLLERGFFVNCTHDNYLTNTRDISYMADEETYVAQDFNGTASGFGYNLGEYKVHKVGDTNLYLIHIEGYGPDNTAGTPSANCPAVGCESVRTPGCIRDNSGNCESVVTDVCTFPDEPAATSGSCSAPIVDQNVICILEKGVESDMCATAFQSDCDLYGQDDATTAPISVALVVALAGGFLSI